MSNMCVSPSHCFFCTPPQQTAAPTLLSCLCTNIVETKQTPNWMLRLKSGRIGNQYQEAFGTRQISSQPCQSFEAIQAHENIISTEVSPQGFFIKLVAVSKLWRCWNNTHGLCWRPCLWTKCHTWKVAWILKIIEHLYKSASKNTPGCLQAAKHHLLGPLFYKQQWFVWMIWILQGVRIASGEIWPTAN